MKKGDKIRGKYYHFSPPQDYFQIIEGEAVQWNKDKTSLLIKVTKATRTVSDDRFDGSDEYNYAIYKGKEIKVSESIWITDLYNNYYMKDYFWEKK